jgi:multidrug efflux pump subunit AcrA (membrane-fusion protein)
MLKSPNSATATAQAVNRGGRVSAAGGSERDFREGLNACSLAHYRSRRCLGGKYDDSRSERTSSSGASGEIDSVRRTAQAAGQGLSRMRRRLVPLAIAAFVTMILCLPWPASVGAYGALTPLPEEEAIIRAPESATLTELRVRPGDLTEAGAVIGRMGNLELEEQLAQTQAEIARANADYDRLLGELKAREESIVRAEANLRRRRRDYDESYSERRQMVGQYFPKGAEICRVADTRRLLARIQASEREIGEVRAGHPARLKVSAYPDHVFRGKVVRVGSESETDQNGQVDIPRRNGDRKY